MLQNIRAELLRLTDYALNKPINRTHDIFGENCAFCNLDIPILILDRAFEDDNLASFQICFPLVDRILHFLGNLRPEGRYRHTAFSHAPALENRFPGSVNHRGGNPSQFVAESVASTSNPVIGSELLGFQ